MELLVALIPPLLIAAVSVLKMLIGTNNPQEVSIEHIVPDLEVSDGKTAKERLADLGLV